MRARDAGSTSWEVPSKAYAELLHRLFRLAECHCARLAKYKEFVSVTQLNPVNPHSKEDKKIKNQNASFIKVIDSFCDICRLF